MRVLHVLTKLEKGGAESRILEMQRNLKDKDVIFDYLLMSDGKHFYTDEALSLGSKIYVIEHPSFKNLISYISKVKKLVKENNYDIVHSHLSVFSAFVLFGAKLGGARLRIVHSRSGPLQSEVKNFSFKRKALLKLYNFFINHIATNLVSCSTDAALYLYGSKAVEKNKVTYIRNAINFNRFEVDESRESIKKRYGIDEDKTVFVNVGNLLPVKNQVYLSRVFNEYQKLNKNSVLLIAGEGPEGTEIEKTVKQLGNNDIKLLGRCDEVPSLLSIADFFVMTSKYEGVPGAAIEAMASGVPCFLSDKITRDIDFGENVTKYFSNDNSPEETARIIFDYQDKMEHSKEKFQKILKENRYEVNDACADMLSIYKGMKI